MLTTTLLIYAHLPCMFIPEGSTRSGDCKVSLRRFISFCIYYLRSRTILGSFISGCNMKATSTRICFIDVRQIVKIWTKFPAVGALPIKSTIFEASAKLLTRFSIFSKFRTGSSKPGCNMEHFRKVCKNDTYHRQFGLMLRQT